MIQLEQQQHGEFWVGGVVGWVTYQLPISSSPVAGSIKQYSQNDKYLKGYSKVNFSQI